MKSIRQLIEEEQLELDLIKKIESHSNKITLNKDEVEIVLKWYVKAFILDERFCKPLDDIIEQIATRRFR